MENIEYKDLLESHFRFGTTSDDIAINMGLKNVLENVIIAPWWGHEMFEKEDFKIEQINNRLFNVYNNDISFSFIEVKNIGASAVMDFVLALGVTKCKNIIFLGSAGSLDENIKIGDIVIPEYSICGDGASRYLNKNLEDSFLEKNYPTKSLTNVLIDLLKKQNIKYHYVPNFSVDNIFAQFYHIDKIMGLGAKTIEMETANLFMCGKITGINVIALFCISDNIVAKKSLYSGRTDKEHEYRHNIRYNLIPRIAIDLIRKININKN